MKVNDIIVLENEERYTLLQDTILDEATYFLSAGIDEEENIDYKKLAILKLIHEEDGDYVEVVNDEQLIKRLSKTFEDAMK